VLRKHPELRTAILVAIAIGALRLAGCGTVELAEMRALDYRLRQRGASPASSEVVIVAVDDRSIAELGRWPWPRARMAELIDRIAAAGPAVVGFDLVQSELSDDSAAGGRQSRAAEGGDALLVDAVRRTENAVLGYFFELGRGGQEAPQGESVYPIVRRDREGVGESRVPHAVAITRNLPDLDAAARARGFFNFLPDSDGLYRRAPMAVAFGGQMATPLSLTMLSQRWPERPLSISFDSFGVTSVRFGSQSIPVGEDGQLLLNFRGKGRTFRHVAAVDLLGGEVPAEELRDKLVIVGVTAVAVGDVRAMPLDPVYPGVELHATALDNILRNDFLYQGLATPGDLSAITVAEIALIAAGCILLGLVLSRARGVRGAFAAACLLAAWIFGSQLYFLESGVALRAVYASLAFLLTYVAIGVEQYVAQERQTRETRRMLDLYLSPAVARELSLHPEMIKLGGEKRDRTVLFSDVKSFTAISERLDPADLVELLNLYLGEMTDIVFQYDGMLDKYIGDGVMAVWGAPLPQDDHALRACRAALAMIQRMTDINARGAERGWPEMKIRIGINSGPMVFGNMGSTRHLSLTVMGDNVNLAARLEGINKLYRTAVIASEDTYRAIADEILGRDIDLVRVRGRTQVARIFELLGPASDAARWQPLLREFDAGLAAYRAREWDAAIAALERAAAIAPDDGPTDLYLRRSRQYREQPPPAGWEPITDFSE